MEQKFKKILQKTKAWQEGRDPLARTFEGALFSGTSWPFSFQDEQAQPATEKTVISQLKSSPAVSVPAASEPVQNSDYKTLVVFLGDTFKPGSDKEDLLGKMIVAMKLQPTEFIRIKFNEALDDVVDPESNSKKPGAETLELYRQIIDLRPQVVVTLGATVTNILLGRREKLSGIHGQFFEKELSADKQSHTFSWCPVFHPDFLQINPNMKRTAWIDLQKVMERVGKI